MGTGGGGAVGSDEFGAALRELFTAAGSPTLAQAVAGAAEYTPSGRPAVTVTRISNWRSGRHLPDSFATIEPLLIWLTAATVTTGSGLLGSGATERRVIPLPRWRALLTAAHTATTAVPAAERVDAAEALIIECPPHHETGLRTGQDVNDVLPSASSVDVNTAVLALTAVDPITGDPRAARVRPDEIPAAALHVLTTTALVTSTSPPLAQWSEVQWSDSPQTLHRVWPRLADLLDRYHPALAARARLLDDAARWDAAGQQAPLFTATQLAACGRHLTALPGTVDPTPGDVRPSTRVHAGKSGTRYRFGGGATHADIPGSALRFWDASHAAAAAHLTRARMIMATISAIAVLAIIAAAVAGIATA